MPKVGDDKLMTTKWVTIIVIGDEDDDYVHNSTYMLQTYITHPIEDGAVKMSYTEKIETKGA